MKKNIGITKQKASCREILRKGIRLIEGPPTSATYCLFFEKIVHFLEEKPNHKPKSE